MIVGSLSLAYLPFPKGRMLFQRCHIRSGLCNLHFHSQAPCWGARGQDCTARAAAGGPGTSGGPQPPRPGTRSSCGSRSPSLCPLRPQTLRAVTAHRKCNLSLTQTRRASMVQVQALCARPQSAAAACATPWDPSRCAAENSLGHSHASEELREATKPETLPSE